MTPAAAHSAIPRTTPAEDKTTGAFRRTDADARYKDAWSPARVSAAVAVTRPAPAAIPFIELLSDELSFFTETGTRRDVRHGVVLMRRGEPARDVHLVERGVVAAIRGIDGHRPISAFALANEVCGAIPALLGQPAEWDNITLADSSLITVSADRFNAAVRDGWVDRWATRALCWLAEFGVRATDLDGTALAGQVAALLLRHRDGPGIDHCTGALADVLDVDEDAIGRILAELRRLGMVRLVGNRVSVTRAEKLHGILTAARQSDSITGSASSPRILVRR
jgi:CRP-like cAMP-binding protein